MMANVAVYRVDSSNSMLEQEDWEAIDYFARRGLEISRGWDVLFPEWRLFWPVAIVNLPSNQRQSRSLPFLPLHLDEADTCLMISMNANLNGCKSISSRKWDR